MDVSIFLERCDQYCAKSGAATNRPRPMSSARLSTILFGSGVTLDRLRDGKGVTVRVLERAIARLAGLEAELEQPTEVAA